MSKKLQQDREFSVKQHRQYDVLLSLSHLVESDMSTAQYLQVAVEQIDTALDVGYCKILQFHSDREFPFSVTGSVGWPVGLYSSSEPAASWCLEHHQPIWVNSWQADSRFTASFEEVSLEIQSGICVIIGPVTEPYGVLQVNSRQCAAFTPEDFEFLQGAANMIVLMLGQQQSRKIWLSQKQTMDSLLDAMPDHIFMLNPEYRFTYVNKATAHTIGLSKKQIIGKTPNELGFCKDFINYFETSYLDALHGTTVKHEMPLHTDAGERMFEHILSPIYGHDGQVVAVAGSTRDVHERVQMEQRLAAEEARFRAIADAAPLMIWVTNIQHQVLYANKAMLSFYGVNLNEYVQLGWEEFIHPDDLPHIQNIIDEPYFEIEFRARRYDGTYRWLLATGNRLSADGITSGHIGSTVDIHDRKQIAEQLKEAKEQAESASRRLSAISRIQSEFIAESNLDVLLNDFLQEILELTQSEYGTLCEVQWDEKNQHYLMPRRIHTITKNRPSHKLNPSKEGMNTLINESDATICALNNLSDQAISDQRQTVIQNEVSPTMQKQLCPARRAKITAYMSIPIHRNSQTVAQLILANRPDGYSESLIDFLEPLLATCANVIDAYRTNQLRLKAEKETQQLAEQLEQRVIERTAQLQAVNHELESFSYSISHDLRAPLRSIDGFSQAAIDSAGDQLNEKTKDYLQRVRKSSQQMAHLIDDILNLSRLTRGNLHLEDNINLSTIAQDIANDLQQQEPERQADFEIQPNIMVRGDRRLLSVVLQNLLHNAWKFSAKEPVAQISFTCSDDPETGKPVYVVQDNGVGFDMTYSDKLFGAFQRLHAADEFPGSGIGLATVKRIISRHGGKIWATSNPSHGAIFYFMLEQ